MDICYTRKLIILFYISCKIYSSAHIPDSLNLWCRYCSAVIGDTSHIFKILSPEASKVEDRYMFGKNVTVQTLVNPFLFKFDVLTTENASCADVGRSIGGRTWFPGYAWRICTCPRCSGQLGWTFEKESSNYIEGPTDFKKSFHVLMLKSLLGLTEDDDPAVGMLSFLKYSKPFTSSTMPPFHLRANDVTAATKEDAMTTTKQIDFKNSFTTESNTAIETKNDTEKSTTIFLTRTYLR